MTSTRRKPRRRRRLVPAFRPHPKPVLLRRHREAMRKATADSLVTYQATPADLERFRR